MTIIYLVMNARTYSDKTSVFDVVSAHRSYQRALDELATLARENGTELEDGGHSAFLPIHGPTDLVEDEYYLLSMDLED